MKQLPTREEILWYLKYDKDRGVLIWQNHHFRSVATRFIGKEAGIVRDGHKQFSMNNRLLLIHRVIWFIEKNEWANFIDHIDGNPANNKISNLRNVDNRVNQQNRVKHRAGKLVGATYHKRNDRWMSRIVINKKIKYLGCYLTEVEAHQAYLLEFGKLKKRM